MQEDSLSRRHFLKATLAGSAALAAGTAGAMNADPVTTATEATLPNEALEDNPLPMRPLGKTGAEVTMLCIGGMMEALNNPRFYEMAWSLGIRYFDTAQTYIGGKSETNIANFLKRHPERREKLFISSKADAKKNMDRIPELVDERLEKCQIDCLDLFFMHDLHTSAGGTEEALAWLKDPKLAKIAEDLKKAGKIKYFGFSSHSADSAQLLDGAAKSGIIDAILISYSPLFEVGSDFDKGLTACHEAGIGLISMKQLRALNDIPKRYPDFDSLGLTSAQVVLHAVWSDERIASVCSMMENNEQLTMNVEAAQKFEHPLDDSVLNSLRKVAQACNPRFCPNCDGRCMRAAGVDVPFNDIARFVSYYEMDGMLEAKDWAQAYLSLPDVQRKIAQADLAAASEACLCRMDFAAVMKKAERYFS